MFNTCLEQCEGEEAMTDIYFLGELSHNSPFQELKWPILCIQVLFIKISIMSGLSVGKSLDISNMLCCVLFSSVSEDRVHVWKKTSLLLFVFLLQV